MASADKQALRNREIRIAAARGERTKGIATRYDISPTRVRQIVPQQTETLVEITDADPVRSALERRERYETVYEEAMALFESIPASNPSPKVGALRLALATLDRLTVWDQAIGVIPGRLAQVSDQLDVRRFLDALIESLKASGASEEVIEKALEEMANNYGET